VVIGLTITRYRLSLIGLSLAMGRRRVGTRANVTKRPRPIVSPPNETMERRNIVRWRPSERRRERTAIDFSTSITAIVVRRRRPPPAGRLLARRR